MKTDELILAFTDEEDSPVIDAGTTQVTTLPELLQLVPDLAQPAHLIAYCGAVNHLKYGSEYRLITDPDDYRARYEAKYAAEDRKAPFREGVVRLRDFGRCETGEIQSPQRDGESVVFYVEDDSLMIPYRVTGPAPGAADGTVRYEPLPMRPNKK